jgi:hypothetical protein
MNRINLVVTVIAFFLLSINLTAQKTSDYFVGKWNVLVIGTPNGDAKMIISMERKDGKLEGMVILGDQGEQVKLTSIEETEKTVALNFPAGGYDVRLSLSKVDDDHVSGALMDQFEAKGERMKIVASMPNTKIAPDYFAGKWNLLVTGTPDGDIKMIVFLERKAGKLDGTITIDKLNETLKFTKVDENGTSITLNFSATGYDLYITLNKKDETHVTGTEMGMFDVKGERVIN